MFATYLMIFCRVTIALLFIFSATSKILAVTDFAVTIGDFKLFPRRWSKTVALLFVSGEIVTAMFVVVGNVLLSIGFLLAIALLAIFSAALAIALRGKIDLNCNCFGRSERRVSLYDIARNGLLILCCLIGLLMVRYASQSLPWGEIMSLAFMSAVFAVFVTNLGDVIETLCQPFPVKDDRQ